MTIDDATKEIWVGDAWLDAVLRTQARPTMMPERPWAEKNTLTDAIEGALRTGGHQELEFQLLWSSHEA